MFTITAYQNKSASNVINKDIYPIVEMKGNLKEGCSITDPVIKVHLNGTEGWRYGFNYFYIDAFKRYYYVTNMIALVGQFEAKDDINPTGLWEMHGHVDVLMSFKDEIKQQNAVVARQQELYNMMLDDGFFMSYQNPRIQTKLFSNAAPFETQEFVLVVAGS